VFQQEPDPIRYPVLQVLQADADEQFVQLVVHIVPEQAPVALLRKNPVMHEVQTAHETLPAAQFDE